MSDGNDFLMGGGIPSAKFAIKGASIRGVILSPPVTMQQQDFVTKEPKFYRNGDPQMMVVIRLQTDQRDPDIEGDDGERGLYVNGIRVKALRDAIRRTGAKGAEVGGTLVATYVRDEMPTGGLAQGSKVIDFVYTRPATALDDVVPPAQNYNAPAEQAAPKQATGSPLDQLNDEQRAALAALGFKS